jgi:membrane protein YqaA with SNARE-associated domain
MEKNFLKRFGIKNILIIVSVIAFSVLIIVFSRQLRHLARYGYFGLFLITFLGNATVIIPVPILAPLNILLGSVLPSPLLVGLVVGLASSLGELSGYLLGYSGGGLVKSSKVYKKIEGKVKEYGLWTIFFLALIPNPLFDIAGLASGALGIKWWKFLIATIAGKTIRAIAFAYLGYYSGMLIGH